MQTKRTSWCAHSSGFSGGGDTASLCDAKGTPGEHYPRETFKTSSGDVVMLQNSRYRCQHQSHDLPRLFACSILVHSWATLRFDDHRGITLSDVTFTGGSMTARLTRSKTIGSNRDVSSRMVFVNACYWFSRENGLLKVGQSSKNCS